MRIDYSKPSVDIAKESVSRIQNEKKLFEEQKATSSLLLNCEDRKVCIVCNLVLKGEQFEHRGIPFISCETCGHIMTKAMPPKGYPLSATNGLNFEKIYPKLNRTDYEDRKKRIYKPKLDWAISCLNEFGYSSEKIKQMKWTEMGCGAGYFLSALTDFGAKNISGFDADKRLVENGNEYLKVNMLHHFLGELEKGMENYPADIYASFFVLEHLENSFHFFNALKQLKPGSIFIFSVPVFGLSAILDNIFNANYARNLDAVIHTQIYTQQSIEHAMRLADFSIVSQWIFGQDADDLFRMVTLNLRDKGYPEVLYNDSEKKLLSLRDSFQSFIDKIHFADQRHIVAIKN